MMLKAIPRYGARVPPETRTVIAECRARGQLVCGPQIARFEDAFARRLGLAAPGIATSYGRMAFYYILKAHAFPPGSEIIVPALTFWAIPELARVAGLKVVFADVDPVTFNISPEAIRRALSSRTRAVVPTHMYGLPCDMDEILSVAASRNLCVIEDCAHALGAHYRGRPVGTMGDAAFFSFQTLKPLGTFRGGMAIVRDGAIHDRVQDLASAGPWPDEKAVRRRLRLAWLERTFMRAAVFTFSGFPILWVSSLWGGRPDVYLWEKVRSLNPLPPSYTERYSNVQAALGLAGLAHLDEWTRSTERHARFFNRALDGCARIPYVPQDSEHVYYQYSIPVSNHEDFVRRALRSGVDVEMLHMDVCPHLPLFAESAIEVPGADVAAAAVQLPVYASLSDRDVARVARVAKAILRRESSAMPAPTQPLAASKS